MAQHCTLSTYSESGSDLDPRLIAFKVHGASVSPAEIIVVSEFVEGGVLRRLLDDPRKLKHLTKR